MRSGRDSRSTTAKDKTPRTFDAALESTANLLARIRAGDPAAREILVARCIPALRRFAHGRVPARARSVMDTDDLVQITVMRIVQRLDQFQDRGGGSLIAYLRRAVLNEIRDEARRLARAPVAEELDEKLVDPVPDPLEQVIGRQSAELYERALAELPPEHQEAIILRLEMGTSYAEIAESIGRPSANAARLLTSRALVRLVERMRALRDGA